MHCQSQAASIEDTPSIMHMCIYSLAHPIVCCCRRHLKFVERPTQEKDNFAEYLIGLALLDYDMLEYPASLVAASAVSLACYSFDTRLKNQSKKQVLEAIWPAAIASQSGYSRTELTPCLKVS